MKLTEISTLAKKHGIVPGHHSKSELIKSIQSKEGNFDCFATAYAGACDQAGCGWREDCFTAASIGKPSIA